jgi:hypothetical protein
MVPFGLAQINQHFALELEAQADLWARVLRAICRFAHDHYRDNDGKTLLPDPPQWFLAQSVSGMEPSERQNAAPMSLADGLALYLPCVILPNKGEMILLPL